MDANSNDLCQKCGLCCNGVIFADVKVQPQDDANRLRTLGLPLTSPRKSALRTPHSALPQKWSQPCAALEGCRCRIYAERPQYCRQFECSLIKRVNAGHVQPEAALRIIRNVQARAEKVRGLLRELGDRDEERALAGRFRRTAKRMEKSNLSEETAERFAQLTLAVHDLNLLVSEEMYPGKSDIRKSRFE